MKLVCENCKHPYPREAGFLINFGGFICCYLCCYELLDAMREIRERNRRGGHFENL